MSIKIGQVHSKKIHIRDLKVKTSLTSLQRFTYTRVENPKHYLEQCYIYTLVKKKWRRKIKDLMSTTKSTQWNHEGVVCTGLMC
jgi:hypothetical protein